MNEISFTEISPLLFLIIIYSRKHFKADQINVFLKSAAFDRGIGEKSSYGVETISLHKKVNKNS